MKHVLPYVSLVLSSTLTEKIRLRLHHPFHGMVSDIIFSSDHKPRTMEGFEMFDIALEGTTIKDCLRHQEENIKNGIVIDTNDTYGSTYKGYQKLRDSRYIQNCVIHKQEQRERKDEVLVEAFPFLIRPTDKRLLKIRKTGMMEFLRFIKIESHYYIDSSGKAYKIPYTKADIASSDILSLKEKSLFGKLFRGDIGFDELSRSLSEDSKRTLIEGVVGDSQIDARVLERYIENFGDVPFIYPQHGLKEISEAFARCNSMCGTAYVLDPSLTITNRSENNNYLFQNGMALPAEYKYRIDTKYGTIFAKKIIRRDYNASISYIRVINTRKALLGRTFFASAHGTSFMKVIGLNSDSECCPEGTYLIYVIKADSCVTRGDLSFLRIEDEDVIEDASYEAKFHFGFDNLG